MGELAYNLESFNPAFTAVLLKVQSTIGHSDYLARDLALKNLIQPLAGEYGMHNGQEQGLRLCYVHALIYQKACAGWHGIYKCLGPYGQPCTAHAYTSWRLPKAAAALSL